MQQTNPVHITPSHHYKIHPNIIHPLRLGLPNGIFPSGFPINKLYAFLFSPIHATCGFPVITAWLVTYKRWKYNIAKHPSVNLSTHVPVLNFSPEISSQKIKNEDNFFILLLHSWARVEASIFSSTFLFHKERSVTWQSMRNVLVTKYICTRLWRDVFSFLRRGRLCYSFQDKLIWISAHTTVIFTEVPCGFLHNFQKNADVMPGSSCDSILLVPFNSFCIEINWSIVWNKDTFLKETIKKKDIVN
jgi:hypothetical protein